MLSYLVVYTTTMNHFSIRLWRAVKNDFIQQSAMTGSVVGWSSSSEALPKDKLVPIKGSWSLVVYCLSDTLQLSKSWKKTITSEKYAQQIDEMHWKLQCLQPALVNRKDTIFLHDNTPQCMAQPMLQMLNELGYNGLPYLLYLTDISPTDYHLVKHLDNFFPGKVCPQLAGWRKCFPRVHWIPKHGFLCYRNKQAYSLWQKWF